jgi:hypothetical protein
MVNIINVRFLLLYIWLMKGKEPRTHKTNEPHPRAITPLKNSILAKPLHCSTPHHNTRAHYFAYIFQVWPPKSGSYLLIVIVMMGILVPETC